MNIGIVGGYASYEAPFEQHGKLLDVSRPDQVEYYNVDVLVFCGGEDVDPFLYGEEPHFTTSYNPARDSREIAIFEEGLRRGVKMCGICRGSQFLTVMSGGLLVQHIDNHGIYGTHDVADTRTGKVVGVTSTHHQMMYPYNLQEGKDYRMLAVCKYTSTLEGVPEGRVDPPVDVEAVWYPRTKALCVQFHPEYMPKTSEGWLYYQALLNEFVF